MAKHLDTICSLIVAAAALVMTGTYVGQEFASSQHRHEGHSYQKNWRELIGAGVPVGNPNAPIKMVEFGDFQCPFCRNFAAVYDSVKSQYGDRVELVFIHVPIHAHKYALPAARAAECAAAQGHFADYYHLIYANQDSLGSWSWTSVAHRAGVPDASVFNKCFLSPAQKPRIVLGSAVAKQFEVEGTPTIIVNGWRFYSTPTSADLMSAINLLLQKRYPFPQDSKFSRLRHRLSVG